jgi:hypothetical protein
MVQKQLWAHQPPARSLKEKAALHKMYSPLDDKV